MERRHLYSQAQPRHAPQLSPCLPPPLSHPLRRLRPLLLRHLDQGGLATAATAPWPHRGQFAGKCIGASIKGEKLETAVWSDVSRFLIDPDDLIDELLAESNDAASHAVAEAERASLIDARDAAQLRRKRAIDLYTRAKLSDDEFDAIAADVERELNTLDERLAVLEPDDDSLDDAVSDDVLAEFRHRLAEDLSDAERREIVQLLVRRITVHTTLTGRGRKQVRVVIDYRFPRVGEARTGIAASHSYNLRRVIAA